MKFVGLLLVFVVLLLAGCSLAPLTGHTTPAVPGHPLTPTQTAAGEQVYLLWFARVLFAVGILALIAGVVFVKLGTIGDYCRSGGATAVGVALGVFVIAAFVKALLWLIGTLFLLAVLGCIVGVYIHRNDIIPTIKAKLIQTEIK